MPRLLSLPEPFSRLRRVVDGASLVNDSCKSRLLNRSFPTGDISNDLLCIMPGFLMTYWIFSNYLNGVLQTTRNVSPQFPVGSPAWRNIYLRLFTPTAKSRS